MSFGPSQVIHMGHLTRNNSHYVHRRQSYTLQPLRIAYLFLFNVMPLISLIPFITTSGGLPLSIAVIGYILPHVDDDLIPQKSLGDRQAKAAQLYNTTKEKLEKKKQTFQKSTGFKHKSSKMAAERPLVSQGTLNFIIPSAHCDNITATSYQTCHDTLI